MIRNLYVSLVLTIGLSACSSSRPVPMGPDTFMLANTGAWSWSSGGELKAELYREADRFCHERGKQMMPVNAVSKDASFTQFAHAEIHFRCLAPGDPELARPDMRPIPDMTIEMKK